MMSEPALAFGASAPQFAFAASSGSTSLGLGSMSQPQQAPGGGRKARVVRMGPPPALLAALPTAQGIGAACSFTTRGSSSAARKLVGRRTLQRSRIAAAPFASIALAAATVTAPAPSSAAPKKKKSAAEIMKHASAKALQGGIPGMVAMAIQVRLRNPRWPAYPLASPASARAQRRVLTRRPLC